MTKKKKFYPGDLVLHPGTDMRGVVLKYSHKWPLVKAHRTGHNTRDVYEVLFSSGKRDLVYHSKLELVSRAEKG